MSTLMPTAEERERRTQETVRRSIEAGGVKWSSLPFQLFLLMMLLVSLGILIVLLGDILISAWPTFRDRGFDFVTSGLSLSPETAGVFTAIIGSLIISLIVIVLAFPVGVAAAVYLEEYAPDNRLSRFIDTSVRNLASVPSIVYGLLGLAVFVGVVNGIGLGGNTNGRNVIAAGITMAVLVLPIVIITSAEAIRAVPNTIREAGFGVGATRWESIRHHIVPAAAPGILTGTVSLWLARSEKPLPYWSSASPPGTSLRLPGRGSWNKSPVRTPPSQPWCSPGHVRPRRSSSRRWHPPPSSSFSSSCSS